MKLPGSASKIETFFACSRCSFWLCLISRVMSWWWVWWSICEFMWKLDLQAKIINTPGLRFSFSFLFFSADTTLRGSEMKRRNHETGIEICRAPSHAKNRFYSMYYAVRQRWLSPLIHPRQENQKKMSVFGTNRKCNKFATLQYKQWL